MKPFAPPFLLVLAFAAPWCGAAEPDPSLTGCWRAVKIVQYVAGAVKAQDSSGRCTLRFDEDRVESTCATANGAVTSTYRYRVERPDFYLATMESSTFKTDLLGSTREYEYHVDGDRLSTATNLQGTQAAGAPSAARVETAAARVPCG